MKIIEKIKSKQSNLSAYDPVTIAFLGDSVTQGCFECFFTNENRLQTVFDYKSAYSTRLKELLNTLYPTVQVNIINSGISGDTATSGLARLKRDVLRYSPDLVVVSFGLNDIVTGGEMGLERYLNSLKEIFMRCKGSGAECIYLTELTMNNRVSCHLKDERLKEYAEKFMKIQASGLPDTYFEKAKELAKACEVTVCDLYSAWKAMQNAGVDTTELLANKLNHPVREFHYYIAIKLLETIVER